MFQSGQAGFFSERRAQTRTRLLDDEVVGRLILNPVPPTFKLRTCTQTTVTEFFGEKGSGPGDGRRIAAN
jgi:hypothetical protein